MEFGIRYKTNINTNILIYLIGQYNKIIIKNIIYIHIKVTL